MAVKITTERKQAQMDYCHEQRCLFFDIVAEETTALAKEATGMDRTVGGEAPLSLLTTVTKKSQSARLVKSQLV